MRASIASAVMLLMTMSSPALAQRRTADTNGATISYDVAGQGEPLVLIHGWSCRKPDSSWRRRRTDSASHSRVPIGKSKGSTHSGNHGRGIR